MSDSEERGWYDDPIEVRYGSSLDAWRERNERLEEWEEFPRGVNNWQPPTVPASVSWGTDALLAETRRGRGQCDAA